VQALTIDWRLRTPSTAGFDDCLAAVTWAVAHAHEYGGDSARIAVGDSACVTLAAVLIYGVFDFAEVGGPIFARTLRDAYLGRGAARCSKTRTDLRGFAMRNSSDRLSCSTAGWRVCTAVR